MIEQLFSLLSAIAALMGALLCLTAAAGLLRFPDLLARMHPASKPASFGMFLFGVSVLLQLMSWRALFAMIVMVFLQMMTVPLGSHLVARTAYRAGLSDPGTLVVDELVEAQGSARRARRRGASQGGSTAAPAAEDGNGPGARTEGADTDVAPASESEPPATT